MVKLSRRMVLQGVAGLSAAWCVRVPPVAGAAPDPGRDSEHPYLPNATSGHRTSASNRDAASYLAEPHKMYFAAYGFNSKLDAQKAFPDVVAYLKERAGEVSEDKAELTAELDENGQRDFAHRRISVGQLGDEREAYYSAPIDGARHLLVVVRVGPNILNVRALAMAGSTDEYMASYLRDFLSAASDDPTTLIPDISDLPVGWKLAGPDFAEDILDIITTPAGGATPAA